MDSEMMIPKVYFDYMKEFLIDGSKFCGIRSLSRDKIFEVTKMNLLKEMKNESVRVEKITIKGHDHYFIIKRLIWDTEFFLRPMHKILAILYIHEDYEILSEAIGQFSKNYFFKTEKNTYCSLEIPSESNVLIQALTAQGFRLVESRLHHYLKDIGEFTNERFLVRKASIEDLENLFKIASYTRNKYDRFHSDVYFNDELADNYLGVFAQETVKGFADMVLVPNAPGVETNALFAVNLLKDEWSIMGANIAQLVLAVVDPNTCRGWYEKLLSELCYYLKENGVEYLITNTQTTNKAPIHVNEKLGFKYSHTTHILTISNV